MKTHMRLFATQNNTAHSNAQYEPHRLQGVEAVEAPRSSISLRTSLAHT